MTISTQTQVKNQALPVHPPSSCHRAIHLANQQGSCPAPHKMDSHQVFIIQLLPTRFVGSNAIFLVTVCWIAPLPLLFGSPPPISCSLFSAKSASALLLPSHYCCPSLLDCWPLLASNTRAHGTAFSPIIVVHKVALDVLNQWYIFMLLMFDVDVDVVVVVCSRRYSTQHHVCFTVGGVWRRFGSGRFWHNDLNSKS